MFICPQCNIYVAEPDFVLIPRKWWQRRGFLVREKLTPVCPAGHKLRGVMGYTTELSLPRAFLQGLGRGFLLIALGFFQDLRFVQRARTWPHLDLLVTAGIALVLGLFSFGRAWIWAGREGPVHRLTSRACGTAMGYFAMGTVACHAMYFEWVDLLTAACRR